MAKLIMTMGLPGSGKSTWALEEVKKSQGKTKRINKDNIRSMVDAGVWSKSNEKVILAIRNMLILNLLDLGFNVIVDDTNFDPKHETDLRNLAASRNASFEIKDFRDVPLETCIERDKNRIVSVGEKVIKGMYNKYLRKDWQPPFRDPNLPNIVIVDIDGTTARIGDRDPYDCMNAGIDKVNVHVVDTVKALFFAGYIQKVIFLSGRDEKCREVTSNWLSKEAKFPPVFKLLMRKDGDQRRDSVIKKEIYEANIAGKYNAQLSLQDKGEV